MTGALIFKIIIMLLLLAVLISLASGMFFLVQDQGESDRTVKSLTVRITLSIALFLMLIIGYFTGLIQPHGISPVAPETERALPE
jgi:amino acid transporter